MKTKFLVSKNFYNRLKFIRKIKGKKIAIYNIESDLLKEFDLCIDMHKLMKGDYYLENLALCDGTTTIVLIDVLIKHGIYVHPFGKIFSFCEQAKETLIIDTFAFKWDEKQIVRPFLFIDPSILGSSMINFYESKNNVIENYYPRIKNFIKMDVAIIEIEEIKYNPTQEELTGYDALKQQLIMDEKRPKTKIVTELIKYVDNLESKRNAISNYFDTYPKSNILFGPNINTAIIQSNNSRIKFKIYELLQNEKISKLVFLSSGIFGADEIELNKTKQAIERHNILVKLFYGY